MEEAKFRKTLLETEAGREYLELIKQVEQKRRVKQRGDGCEKHHVHPRGLGGDKNGHCVLLTCFEHCLAHVLLAKAIPCNETLFPIVELSNSQVRKVSDLDRVTLETVYHWSELRREAFERLHRMPFTEERLQKMSDSHKGKSTSRKGQHLSEDHRQKLSEVWTGKPKPWLKGRKHPKRVAIFLGDINKLVLEEDVQSYLKEGWSLGKSARTRKAMSNSQKGKTISVETKQKISATTVGRKNTAEHNKHISEGRRGIKFTEEHRKHISDVRKGKSSGTKGKKPLWKDGKRRWFFPNEVNDKLKEGWSKSRNKE